MAERLRPIIVVKKIKKHAGHHGGQWKVAYADFITALMAFFLLLWLLAMVSPEKRIALSQYFKEFSVFKEQGEKVTKGGVGILDFKGGGKTAGNAGKMEIMSPEKLKTKIKAAVDANLKTLKDQVLVDVHEGAVRIQIVDNEGSQMFLLGSAKPTDKALEVLSLVSETIRETPNKIVVEGHTDALPYKGGEMTNWELSTARASAARRVLEDDGVTADRIAKVVGYADNDLLIKLYPNDPRNRRISIILLPLQYKNASDSFKQ
ncbi:MAG TPA: flagellar motor protein MotB [Syntrophales bacterium]|nr:flagellar motor protein MotB [Syntrophales bacterium]